MANVSYSAVVLDDRSRQKLITFFSNRGLMPEGWEVVAHHQTINMGEINPQYEKYLGLAVRLNVEEYAINDKVMAVGVSGFYSDNPHPHITIAVNRANGGKPMMSNELTDWIKLKQPLTLTGKVTEVPYKI